MNVLTSHIGVQKYLVLSDQIKIIPLSVIDFPQFETILWEDKSFFNLFTTWFPIEENLESKNFQR